MKRKVGLFLFAVMVAVSLGATIVASLAMYRLVSEKQAAEIRNLEASLSERFAVFQAMLRSQHAEITAHMGKVLPQIVAGGIHGLPFHSSSTAWMAGGGPDLGVTSVQVNWAETCLSIALLTAAGPLRFTTAVVPSSATLPSVVPAGKVSAAFCSQVLFG